MQEYSSGSDCMKIVAYFCCENEIGAVLPQIMSKNCTSLALDY